MIDIRASGLEDLPSDNLDRTALALGRWPSQSHQAVLDLFRRARREGALVRVLELIEKRNDALLGEEALQEVASEAGVTSCDDQLCSGSIFPGG